MAQEPISVLIVEDDEDEAHLIDTLLTSQTITTVEDTVFKSRCVSSLHDGLQLLATDHVDVVLLDLNLTDSHGTDTLVKLRNHTPSVPIVVLTGVKEKNLALKVLQMGAQDYLLKGQSDLQILARSLRYAVERKRSDEKLRKTQAQLIQAEKMKSVGRLAAGAAHEVKNPLAIIGMGVEYMTRTIQNPDDKMKIMLTRMKEAVTRANYVIKGLLDFSSVQEMDIKECDLNVIIEDSLNLVKHEFDRKQLELKTAMDSALPSVFADRNRMQQVFINLLTNAIEATPSHGRVTVRSGSRILDQVGAFVGARKEDLFQVGQKVVVIEVIDSGEGISEQALTQVFDPFYTTKRTSGGTGLGLSVVKSILDEHRALIQLDNEKGAGVKVSILMKVSDVAAVQQKSPGDK